MSLAEFRNVSKDYELGRTRVRALRDVSLVIERGELLALWGPSGSGKSTLCNLVGLLDAATRGTVLFEEQDVARISDNARTILRNHMIGFIFQNFNLIPVLTALENVMLPLQIQGVPVRHAKASATAGLIAVGLETELRRRPHELSGGQQQRVAIARALITRPKMVIADEPTANLDTETALAIIDLIGRMNAEHGTTFLFATHDQRLLEGISRKIRLEDGLLVEDVSIPRPAAAAGDLPS